MPPASFQSSHYSSYPPPPPPSLPASTSTPPAGLSNEEDVEDYAPDGYLNVKVGDEFLSPNRRCPYTVVRKLGWGHFSTVWLIVNEDDGRYAALKVCTSRYEDTAKDEISLLMRVRKRAFKAVPSRSGVTEWAEHPGARHVVSLLDYFSTRGRYNGENHICMVLEPLGENLLNLLDKYRTRRTHPRPGELSGIPMSLVRIIARQVLMGLQFLHDECHLVHTDIKPENILVGLPNTQDLIRAHLNASPTLPACRVPIPESSDRRRHYVDIYPSQPIPCAIPASESNSWNGSPNTLDGSSNSYSSTRSRSRASASSSIIIQISDLGNATPVDKHFTEDIQTRQYRAPEAIIRRSDWGFAVDIWSVACMLFELATGDHLFDPKAKRGVWEKDDDHMAQIIELCGDFDISLKMGGKFSRDIFNSKGQLRHIHTLKPMPLARVFADTYHCHTREAKQFASFLSLMLRVDQELRATAGELLQQQEWLGSYDVVAAIASPPPLPRTSKEMPRAVRSYESYECNGYLRA